MTDVRQRLRQDDWCARLVTGLGVPARPASGQEGAVTARGSCDGRGEGARGAGDWLRSGAEQD